jgi:hypothetical protein
MQNTPPPNTHADTIELIAMDPQFTFFQIQSAGSELPLQ